MTATSEADEDFPKRRSSVYLQFGGLHIAALSVLLAVGVAAITLASIYMSRPHPHPRTPGWVFSLLVLPYVACWIMVFSRAIAISDQLTAARMRYKMITGKDL